jgi:hypothetical protein
MDSGVATTTEPSTETAEASSSETGTRDNPIPLGQQAQVGNWKIKVISATLDAALGSEEVYEPLPATDQYVLVELSATYAGEESGMFSVEMMYKYVGSEGNTFGWIPTMLDGDITDEGEVFAPASVSGHLIFQVASDQVAGGTLMLDEAFSTGGARTFFAVE